MTTFAQHRATVESLVDYMHSGADKDALTRVLAEAVTLTGPLSDEPITGREAVTAAIQAVSTMATDLTYKEVISGETPNAAFFRLQIEDTTFNGMDFILLDADSKIAAITNFWRAAADRRPDAGARRAPTRHAPLGTAHQRQMTAVDPASHRAAP